RRTLRSMPGMGITMWGMLRSCDGGGGGKERRGGSLKSSEARASPAIFRGSGGLSFRLFRRGNRFRCFCLLVQFVSGKCHIAGEVNDSIDTLKNVAQVTLR